MDISKMIQSLYIYCDRQDLEKIKGGVEVSKGKHVWFKDKELPQTLLDMSETFRDKMGIPSKCKLVVTVFTPSVDEIKIDKSTHVLQNRIVLTTIRENPELQIMGKSKPFYMKMNEAYNFLYPLTGFADLIFDNKNHYKLPPRKGFRTNRVIKKLENRYILLFDYIKAKEIDYTDENAAAIEEMNN